MAGPDFTVATPGPGAAGAFNLMLGQVDLGQQQARTDASVKQGRLTSTYQNRTLPQLNSGIAAAGQYYSSNRQKAQRFSAEDYVNGTYDIDSAMKRTLANLELQRQYAATGLIMGS